MSHLSDQIYIAIGIMASTIVPNICTYVSES